jgi:16S rRNA processing protein RimM
MRPHGLRGETVVDLVSNRLERAAVGACFTTDAGELRIAAIRPFGARWLVFFAGVDSRQDAEALRGTVLRAPALEDADALWVHELLGAAVVQAGDGKPLGNVRSVVANPASDLLELDDGTLIPARFVVEHGPGRVVVDVPEGLVG